MKKWYTSKTLWANALMFAGVIVMQFTGADFLNLEVQAGIMAGVNAILRMVTKDAVTL